MSQQSSPSASPSGKGTGKESKRGQRDRLAAERAAQAAADRRRERTLRIVTIAGVLVVVLGIGLAVALANRTKADTGAARPAGTTADGGIPTGTAGPVLDLYHDFQCPACKAQNDAIGPWLDEQVNAGKVKIVYHPLSFLDGNLGNDSSSRSAAASGCAQAQGQFVAYHDVVYKNQPTKEGEGYTDEQLLQFGKDAGIKDQAAFESCVKSKTYAGWVTLVQDNGNKVPITQTPTYVIGGKKLDLSAAKSLDDVKALIEQAITKASG